MMRTWKAAHLTCVSELLSLDVGQLLPGSIYLPAQCGRLADAGPIEGLEQVAMPPPRPPRVLCCLHAPPYLFHRFGLISI